MSRGTNYPQHQCILRRHQLGNVLLSTLSLCCIGINSFQLGCCFFFSFAIDKYPLQVGLVVQPFQLVSNLVKTVDELEFFQPLSLERKPNKPGTVFLQ